MRPYKNANQFSGPLPLHVRFWNYVTRGDGCWEWTGGKNERGYGQVHVGATSRRATHIAWEIATNAPVPRGVYVCHRCDNPGCVRFDHLFLGTAKDNAADRDRKGRGANNITPAVTAAGAAATRGEKQWRARLTEAGVRQIRNRLAAGERYGDLAVEFGVSPTSILDVRHRRTWKHVD